MATTRRGRMLRFQFNISRRQPGQARNRENPIKYRSGLPTRPNGPSRPNKGPDRTPPRTIQQATTPDNHPP
eukprot:jgi/Mesvir1/16566/Mv25192-RA.1